jgi:hypothetical protein
MLTFDGVIVTIAVFHAVTVQEISLAVIMTLVISVQEGQPRISGFTCGTAISSA